MFKHNLYLSQQKGLRIFLMFKDNLYLSQHKCLRLFLMFKDNLYLSQQKCFRIFLMFKDNLCLILLIKISNLDFNLLTHKRRNHLLFFHNGFPVFHSNVRTSKSQNIAWINFYNSRIKIE